MVTTLLTLIKEHTKDKSKDSFTLDDFEARDFQRAYSNYLLGEIKDQLSFYYQVEDYETFLKFFEYLKGKDKFTYDQYCSAYDEMMDYLKSVDRSTPQFMHSRNEFLQFLYDLNVICYLERPKEGKALIHWCFKERNYSNISPKVKTELEYQVFYGLAKALNLGRQY